MFLSLLCFSSPILSSPIRICFATTPGETCALDDIGLFMGKVIENRDRLRGLLTHYSHYEKEDVLMVDQDGRTVFGYRGIYRWTFLEDGIPVRVPQELNGKKLSEEDKEKHRQRWLKAMEDEKDRRKRFKDNRDLFLNAPFDPENYFFAGFEALDGRHLVKVENVPRSAEKAENEMDKILQGASVLMWIDPDTFQIIRLEMSHLNLEVFSALKLFVHIEEASLQLNMKDFNEEIWLPSDLSFQASVKTFENVLSLQYKTTYYDYGKFTVSSEIEFKEK